MAVVVAASAAAVVRLDVVANNDTNYDANDGEDDEGDEEANPTLFAGSAGRLYCLLRVAKTGRTVSNNT